MEGRMTDVVGQRDTHSCVACQMAVTARTDQAVAHKQRAG